jgi:hypothetical protein
MPRVGPTDDQAKPAGPRPAGAAVETPGSANVPVATLAYSRAEEAREPFIFLMKLVVGLAGLTAALDLFRAASSFWIQYSPTPFKGVGTGWARGSVQALIGMTTEVLIGLSATLVVAGAVQFFRRRAVARRLLLAVQFFRRRVVARRLLLWGAVASLVASVFSFAFSLATYSLMQSAGNELRSAMVLTVWRVRWLLGPMMPALLLLLVLPRPEVRRWLSGEP